MQEGFSRREFMKGATAAALGSVSLPLAMGEAPASEKALSHGKLEEFGYSQVRLTGGPLKQQFDRIHASYLSLDNDRLLKVYRERAGLPAPGADMGGWYGAGGFIPGHSLGQYISGLARIGSVTGDRACHDKVRELVEGFAATMGPDDRVYAGAGAEKVWPCYVFDKHLVGLIDAYRLSGVAQARDLLPRVYRGALPYIPAQGRDRIGKKNPPYDETYVLPENLFTAYQITGDRALYERAIAYLLNREYFDPLSRNEDVLPGRQAYSHVIALSSAGKAHLILGDGKYLRAMENASEFLASTQQYSSGGWGPDETFIEPHKGMLYESLKTTKDHFETPCGSYAAMKLARYLLCATADGRYGDGLERVVYNSILFAKAPDGDGDFFYYSTYSPVAHKAYYPSKWPCCSGTLVQGVADYVLNLYFQAPEGIYVNLYAPSEVKWKQNGKAVTLTQQTEYPTAETVELRLEMSSPLSFSVGMRIPSWLEGPAKIRVSGQPVEVRTSRGFAVLHRLWRNGDHITLTLPQRFRTEAIDDLHPETVAILRGPLMYAALNPPVEWAAMPAVSPPVSLDSLHPLANTQPFYTGRVGGKEMVFMPLFMIREENYSSYFLRG